MGPDIPKIARKLGQFKESVRYRYKEKVLGSGFAVQAEADHERLGLKRLLLVADFAGPYREYAGAILTAMSELCYVVAYAKVLPSQNYLVQFSAPKGSANDLVTFLRSLQAKGMFSKTDVYDFDWFRRAPMMPECYDFDSGRWEFEWSREGPESFQPAAFVPSTEEKFDAVDLKIIEELQTDANKSLKSIADDAGINYKKLAWHYSTHVMGRHLIRAFSVRWMGTAYDYEMERAQHRRHSYLSVKLLVKNVTNLEMMKLRSGMNKLPFLWSESVGANYFAEIFFPVDHAVEGINRLSEIVADVRERAELLNISQTDALAFSVPTRLYDQKGKKWTFEPLELEQRFDNLILQIKGGGT